MKISYQLSVLLLAAAGLPAALARGPPGGGQYTGRPGGAPPAPVTTAVAGTTVTPPAAAGASTPPAAAGASTPPASANTAGAAQGTASAAAPGSATSAGSSQSSTPNSCGSNAQKISLQNNSGKNLVIQAGPPWTVGSCGNIASGSTCTFCQTRGSTGGNLQVGYGVAQNLGTWIEGEWDTNAEPALDISFIPGYSVPISCKSDSTGATTGWSTPLCSGSSCSNCASGGGTWNGNSCENPSGPSNPNAGTLTNGPCPKFWASSQGGAYCYPNDNGVVGYGAEWSSVSCTAGAQSGGSAKREESGSFFPRDAQEENQTLEARVDEIARRHANAAAHPVHGRAHARSLKSLLY